MPSRWLLGTTSPAVEVQFDGPVEHLVERVRRAVEDETVLTYANDMRSLRVFEGSGTHWIVRPWHTRGPQLSLTIESVSNRGRVVGEFGTQPELASGLVVLPFAASLLISFTLEFGGHDAGWLSVVMTALAATGLCLYLAPRFWGFALSGREARAALLAVVRDALGTTATEDFRSELVPPLRDFALNDDLVGTLAGLRRMLRGSGWFLLRGSEGWGVMKVHWAGGKLSHQMVGRLAVGARPKGAVMELRPRAPRIKGPSIAALLISGASLTIPAGLVDRLWGTGQLFPTLVCACVGAEIAALAWLMRGIDALIRRVDDQALLAEFVTLCDRSDMRSPS